MSDPFSSYATGLDSPVSYYAAISPSDSTDLPAACRAIWVGVAGDVKLTGVNGNATNFANVPVGWFPCRAVRVWATTTGAAATSLVAGY